MKYLSETGVRHLISKILSKFKEMEESMGGTEITTAEIDIIWEEEA